MVSKYHTDLWEHASKLFRLLRWQQAAEIFEFLGKDVEETRERTKCLVNKALIEARLGDNKDAALSIADAAELGEDMAITAFLAGLINCELSQLALAEAWFEACLTAMDGHDINHVNERLAFTLELATVQHNLDSTGQARLAEELGFDDAAPDDLVYLPANLLFEAPPRTRDSSTSGEDLESPLETSLAESLSRLADKPGKPLGILSSCPSSAYSSAYLPEESDITLVGEDIVLSPDQTASDVDAAPAVEPPRRPTYTPILIRQSRVLKSPVQPPLPAGARELRCLQRIREREAAIRTDGRGPAFPRAQLPYTWHGKPKQHLEPRDARAVSDSVRELAEFVQDFAPEGGSLPVRKIVTRDARRKRAEHSEDAAISEDVEDSDEGLFRPVGAKPKHEPKAASEAVQRKRAVTFDPSAGQPPSLRPSPPLQRNSSLLRGLLSPRTGPMQSGRKPLRVRWPFSDDRDEAEPEASAPTHGALKPAQLNFIMGPDGRTIVIEKAPKATTSITDALQQVRQARRHDPRQVPASPGSNAGQAAFPNPPEEPSVLQPAVYDPPAWRRRKPAPIDVQPPTPTQRLDALISPFARQPATADRHLFPSQEERPRRRSVSEIGTLTPRQRGSGYSQSVVSSVGFLDYVLDRDKRGGQERE